MSKTAGNISAAMPMPESRTRMTPSPPSRLTVSQMLTAVNNQAVGGVLYNGNRAMRDLAEEEFEGVVNLAGRVGVLEQQTQQTLQKMDGMINMQQTDAAELTAGRMYVNIQTSTNPAGELRGQIIMPGATLFTGILAGANEVPPVLDSELETRAVSIEPVATLSDAEALAW